MNVVDQRAVSQMVSAVFAFDEHIGDLLGDSELPTQQIRLLLALYEHRDLMQADLPKYTGVRTTAVSKALHKLSTKFGLLEVNEVAGNRRSNAVTLTVKGRKVIEAAASHAARHVPTLSRRPA